MKNNYDIKDDELRVIGKPANQLGDAGTSGYASQNKSRKWGWWVLFAVVVVAVAGIIAVFAGKKNAVEQEIGLFEEVPVQDVALADVQEKQWLGMVVDSLAEGFAEKIDTTVNDVPLSIFVPHNATAELCLRTPDINDPDIIFCAQAADIRKDNRKIVGAFVLKGEPLAWGLSKRGYCGIIDGKISVGVADNSPLFEEATEKGGYFFRQYPLVDNGVLVDNEPKNKSVRRALCERAGEIFVVLGNTPESFHDFAQALVDLGVDNAIYLVGGEYAKGWYRDACGEMTDFSKGRRDRYRYENYLVWRR
jgi:hypothetical protein